MAKNPKAKNPKPPKTKEKEAEKAIEKGRRGRRKRLHGEVVGSKMEKTVIVEIARSYPHPLYKKIMTDSKRYKVHTEEELDLGAKVTIEECRPLSREKRWRVVDVKK